MFAEGKPLPDAALLVLYPNKTWLEATTGFDGEGSVDLYATELPMRVFVAAPGFAAHYEERWVPAEGNLTVELTPLAKGGAVIFANASGHIPGLSGRLNLGLDSSERSYFFADNIAVNEGKQQPVSFLFGEELQLTDAFGHEYRVRVINVTGRSSLIEYRFAPSAPNSA